ncbi:hypothetical protein EQG63_08840 [Flavobacterium amnicola]|uniref:Phytase-like domain-containing protein n=1 Tax=Flavobacterium amnicola TaxID=2506422 RepID=A0A4Q1K4N1_9FLAO|nr:hypothetical protein [Flavobacterium amnicola]RXR18364.1 hypothetical protein EQG63_08840 [Flavobacterium amnicola]
MEKFQLLAYLTLKGIGSASGILHYNDSLYIISDNSSYLYEYQIIDKNLHKIELVENPQENIAKKDKPDFEAITREGNNLHIFGSGSTKNRNRTFSYHLENKKIKEKDLGPIYQNIKTKFNISDDDLNIEGALFYRKELLLFQRGNGANSKNGIIKIGIEPDEITFFPIQLPKIKHVETSFTDAILVDKKIYFLAAAEDTTSTYEDGEVLGSIIGRIDLETFQLEKSIQITDKHKFEGLTLYQKNKEELTFLLCEDNDTEDLNATIYKLVLNTK